MRRVPTRTLVLMVLALVAFAFMWWSTHHRPPASAGPVGATVVLVADGGTP